MRGHKGGKTSVFRPKEKASICRLNTVVFPSRRRRVQGTKFSAWSIWQSLYNQKLNLRLSFSLAGWWCTPPTLSQLCCGCGATPPTFLFGGGVVHPPYPISTFCLNSGAPPYPPCGGVVVDPPYPLLFGRGGGVVARLHSDEAAHLAGQRFGEFCG